MKCRECNFDNPEGMKFCGECGAQMAAICAACNFSNPPGFKFCGSCGHNLADVKDELSDRKTPLPDKLEKVKKYLPEGLIHKILSQKDKIVGERKSVTVMFCDMVGFTTLIEELGSEQGYSVMDRVYEILIQKVHEYDGTVNEMTGDGIMALFGAPIAIEDAPQRAIRSSLAIHRGMAKFSDSLNLPGIPPLRMRIGINTGSVVVGTLGNDLRVEFKVLFKNGFSLELEQVSNLTTKMAYCSWQGLFISLVGEDYFEAVNKIDDLIGIAKRSGSPFMMLVFNVAKANMLLGIGEYDLVKRSCQNALMAIEGTAIRTGHVTNVYYDLVLAELKTGNQELASGHYEKGKPLVELAPHWWGPRFLFLKGMLLSNEASPDFIEIEECYLKSINDDEKVGAVVPAAQTRYYLAKMLSRKGEIDRASKLFKDLREGFEMFGIPVWQQKCSHEMEPYCF